MNKLAIFSGNANRKLAEDICTYLKVSLKDALVSRFSEGEVQVRINENIRGLDVFVIQSVCSPPNENLMELLILIDALKRASAKRITAVLPYYAYARQDRKDQPRVPITAKLVANLITTAGADRLLAIDLHAGQIQGFFDIPVDHLYAAPVFIEYLKQLNLSDTVVVSPDVGGIKMARAFAKRLHTSLAIVDKRRINTTQTQAMNVIGDVAGKNVIIVDDILATAGSLKEAVLVLKERGAKEIYAAITHSVLSGEAIERIKSIPLRELVVSDTIPIPHEKQLENIRILSIANLLGEAIKRIHQEESVSSLFV